MRILSDDERDDEKQNTSFLALAFDILIFWCGSPEVQSNMMSTTRVSPRVSVCFEVKFQVRTCAITGKHLVLQWTKGLIHKYDKAP